MTRMANTVIRTPIIFTIRPSWDSVYNFLLQVPKEIEKKQIFNKKWWVKVNVMWTYNPAFSDNPSNAAAIAKMNPLMPKKMWYGIITSRWAAFNCGNKNVTNPPIHWNVIIDCELWFNEMLRRFKLLTWNTNTVTARPPIHEWSE